ncbi:Protein pih1d3 [Borealophlyctis nickersoniae]|nr:Protein pih1d3 [Borealophlyctis nickersoniae]
MNGEEPSVLALANLLQASEGQDTLPQKPKAVSQLTPASIHPRPNSTNQTRNPPSSKNPKKQSKNIWDEEQVECAAQDADPRPRPEYDIRYRQNLTSEDMYLGMRGKLPSIEHSDEMVICVHMPGAKGKEIELTCTEMEVDVRCPQ